MADGTDGCAADGVVGETVCAAEAVEEIQSLEDDAVPLPELFGCEFFHLRLREMWLMMYVSHSSRMLTRKTFIVSQ